MLQIVDNSPASQGKIKAISQQLLKLKLSVQNEVGVTYEAMILVMVVYTKYDLINPIK